MLGTLAVPSVSFYSPFSFLSSSGNSLYLLQYYLSYNKFSYSHHYFLATIITGVESTTNSEVASQLKQCVAMKQEIGGLQRMTRGP